MSFVPSREEIAVIFSNLCLAEDALREADAGSGVTHLLPLCHIQDLVPCNKSDCLKLRAWFPC